MPSVSDNRLIKEAVIAALKASIGVGSGATHTIALAQFYDRKLPWEVNVEFPLVMAYLTAEKIADATNAQDDYGFGVGVTIALTSNRDLDATDGNEDKLCYWRERTMRVFNNKRLTGLTDYFCKIEPGLILDPNAFKAGRDATAYVIRVTKRHTR